MKLSGSSYSQWNSARTREGPQSLTGTGEGKDEVLREFRLESATGAAGNGPGWPFAASPRHAVGEEIPWPGVPPLGVRLAGLVLAGMLTSAEAAHASGTTRDGLFRCAPSKFSPSPLRGEGLGVRGRALHTRPPHPQPLSPRGERGETLEPLASLHGVEYLDGSAQPPYPERISRTPAPRRGIACPA